MAVFNSLQSLTFQGNYLFFVLVSTTDISKQKQNKNKNKKTNKQTNKQTKKPKNRRRRRRTETKDKVGTNLMIQNIWDLFPTETIDIMLKSRFYSNIL